MLAVVLIVQSDLNGLEPVGEDRPRIDTVCFARVGVAAPLDEDTGEIAVGTPILCFDQGQNAGSVGSRFRTEDTVASLRFGVLDGKVAFPLELCEIVLARKVLLQRFIELHNQRRQPHRTTG